MTYSTYIEASQFYVNELLKRDDELASKMSKNKSDIMNIYRIYRERLSLFERAGTMPLIEEDKVFLENRRNEICHELREFRSVQNKKFLVETNTLTEKIENQYFSPPMNVAFEIHKHDFKCLDLE